MNKISAKALTIFIKNKQKREFMYNLLINKIKLNDYICHSKESSFVGYNIKGENNKIIVIENGIEKELLQNERIDGLDIIINGNNNVIKLELPLKVSESIFEIWGNNNSVCIGTSPFKIKLFINLSWMCHNRKIIIGNNFSCDSAELSIAEDDAICQIGDDCMFSRNIVIRSDGHAILNANGEVLNNLVDIKIGNHCWVGENVCILKNTKICDNSIIGAWSLITKIFTDKGVIIAGNPAKIIKSAITWDRENASIYIRRKGSV